MIKELEEKYQDFSTSARANSHQTSGHFVDSQVTKNQNPHKHFFVLIVHPVSPVACIAALGVCCVLKEKWSWSIPVLVTMSRVVLSFLGDCIRTVHLKM